MENLLPITFPCLKCVQPIGEFYIGVISSDDLITITFVDVRRLENSSEMREVEIYSGIQRELSSGRVKEISKYVNTIDATFPTGVILHIKQSDCEYDEEAKTMTLPFRNNVAKVLDGQHRIAGLENYNNQGNTFQMNITIFVEMELEDQALVFATINKTQTKVNKSLVSDLFAFATHRSPQKTAHNIVRALNEKEDSPFYDKIKILGTANNSLKETITQATFTESLIRYMSKDIINDRDIYKRGKKPEKFQGSELINRPLRNLFIEEKDGVIAKIIYEYFKAVQTRWPIAWDVVQSGYVLNKSTGLIALMLFFKDAYLAFNTLDSLGSIITYEQYLILFSNVTLIDSEFNKENYIPGDIGQRNLYRDLLTYTNIQRATLNQITLD